MQESHSRQLWKPPRQQRIGVSKVSVKDHIISNLGFTGQIVSVTANQLGHYNVKVTIGHAYEYDWLCCNKMLVEVEFHIIFTYEIFFL